MRAVAILAVVLYHAHVGFLRGGFTGVDDFYVISGFLITGLLWRQLEGGHRISFRSFYGRRIQRLLPMSFVVLVATALVSARFLPPLQAHASLKDGVSAAFYVSNYRFAALQTNYLTAGIPPSPFQQYWSLSLEEQFYLVWPLLLLGASMIWQRRPPHNRRVSGPSRAGAVTALAVLAVASFAFAVWLTGVSQPWAFFSLPTRAWELAVGGLVAFAAPWLGKLNGRSAALLGWGGLAVVIGSAVIVSSSVPYPGTAALAPVLGTAAVIASGCSSPRRGPILVLGRTGARLIGRVSYSWYLWHWPVLILAPYVVGHALSLGANLALVLGSFVLALISFVTVEDPVWLSSWFRAVPRRVMGLGGVLTAAAASVCLVSISTLPSLTGQGTAPVARLSTAQPASGADHSGAQKTTLSTPHPNPYVAQLASVTAQVQQAVARSLPVRVVPANLTPSRSRANADEPRVVVDGCLDSYLATALESCDFGDTSSPTSVVLFGDSHAAMWFSAVDGAAHQLELGLFNWTKATCPPLMIPIISPVLGRNFVECDEWLQDMSAMITAIRKLGPQVLVLGPVPKPPFDVPGCLSVHLTKATACKVPLNQGINEAGLAAERRAVTAAGGTYFDVSPWLCTTTTCAVMVDNLLVYRDDNHLTDTYTTYLAPAMTDELGIVLGRRPPTPTTSPTATVAPASPPHDSG